MVDPLLLGEADRKPGAGGDVQLPVQRWQRSDLVFEQDVYVQRAASEAHLAADDVAFLMVEILVAGGVVEDAAILVEILCAEADREVVVDLLVVDSLDHDVFVVDAVFQVDEAAGIELRLQGLGDDGRCLFDVPVYDVSRPEQVPRPDRRVRTLGRRDGGT
ncbi:MAG: hypothetical protein HY859_09235 [Caulobacterales bacterium]|nr:hypothetical protein [Caulobacterales bacterium]